MLAAPFSLLRSNLSHGAIHTYLLLSVLPTNKGRIWVSQGHLGNQLNCSTRHVRNFLKELELLNFLLSTGELHGKNRVYRLLQGPTEGDLGSGQARTGEAETTELKEPPTTFDDPGTLFPQIKKLNSKLNLFNLSRKTISELPKTQAQSLLEQNPDWETEFQCFDGKEGRPMLIQKIEEAVTRFNYGSLLGYVKHYLRNGAKWLLQSLAKVYNLSPEIEPASLEELDRERHDQEAKKRAYNNRYMPKEIKQTEEDQNFIREAFSKLTMGIRNNFTAQDNLLFAI